MLIRPSGGAGHTSARGVRRLTLLCAVMALSMPLAACGDEEEADAPRAERRAPITVKHALGTTRVPGEPQRIVVTNPYALLDYLLALGIKPVGSSGDTASDFPFATWLKGKTDDITLVGGVEGLHFERLAAVKPDLILADPWRTEEYKRLSRIAPTVRRAAGLQRLREGASLRRAARRP